MERFFDIIFSILALLLFAPFLVIIVIILRFSGEGEVFFLQERIGRNGEVFHLFKLATMLKDSPHLGTGTITIKNDPRVLPIGKFLRKTKINELPQLLNILLGDMSIIGPRPLTPQTFNSYPRNTQDAVKKVKPGLSGIGSIIFRGEEDIMHGESVSIDLYQNVIAPYKGSLEEWFVLNKSLNIYFIGILMTLWVVINPNTKIVWKVFKDLPEPPKELRQVLNYCV